MNRIYVACIAVAGLTACATSHGPEPDSETHFLEACEVSCPDGLECLCGVCTLPCDDDLGCSDLDPEARCDAPVTTDGMQCAPTEAAPGICQLEPLSPDRARCGGVWSGMFVASDFPQGRFDEVHSLEALAGYERVEGDVVIDWTDAVDLSMLSCLQSAHGLGIGSNAELRTLAGLENLALTEPRLGISNNPKLEDLSALRSIWQEVRRDPPPLLGNISVGGQTGALSIFGNNSLVDLTGLEGIEEIAGAVEITGTSLQSVAVLRGLHSVGGDLLIGGQQLESLAGLEDLRFVAGNLSVGADPEWIVASSVMRDLSPLRNLREIGGLLDVNGHANLRGGVEMSPQSLGLTGLQHLAERPWAQKRASGWSAMDNAALGWECCDGCGRTWGCPQFVPSAPVDEP
jgi:hypothetical protein